MTRNTGKFQVTFNDVVIFEREDNVNGCSDCQQFFDEIAGRNHYPKLSERGAGREMRNTLRISGLRETPQGMVWVTDTVKLRFVSE